MKGLTLQDLRAIVPDADELAKGAKVHDDKALAHLARWENKLYAEAAGSGSSPYKVSLTFGEQPRDVKARCSCMAARSRPFCKHACGLLIAWSRAPDSFVETTTPPAEATGAGGKKKSVKKGAVDEAALMRDGVERVATLVRELGTSGVASLGAERVPQMRTLSENLRENKLRRLSARVLELADLLDGRGMRGLPALEYTELVADLLLTVRKLEKHLAGEALDERHVEELVGKTWTKKDRKPAGGLKLVEYSFLRWYTADSFAITESRFVDLATGTHYSEKQIIPDFLVKRTAPKRSYAARVLQGSAGSIFPGYPPLRLNLETPGQEAPLDAAGIAELVDRALPGAGAALAAFQEHRKDVFAPDRLPVAVRVDTLYAGGSRLQVVDVDGHALHLPLDESVQEQLAGTLRGVHLRALLGDIGLELTLPTLFPRAAVVEGPLGLELRILSALDVAPRKARAAVVPAGTTGTQRSDWIETARGAGASEVAIRLGEVREDLADAFVTGVASLTTRTTDAMVTRLREQGLDKPAALLTALVGKANPEERIDDLVRLFQVLGIALVRLAGLPQIDRASMVRVPTYESVSIPRPAQQLEPQQATALRDAGRLNRYQAAWHVARFFELMPPDEISRAVYPTWADGSVAPFVAAALARHGDQAVAAACAVLDPRAGRNAGNVALMTALRVLRAAGGQQAREFLKTYARDGRDAAARMLALESLVELKDPAAARQVEEIGVRVGDAIGRLLGAGQKEDRETAAAELARHGSSAAVPALRAAFHTDATADVRAAAAYALANLVDTEMVDSFLRSLAARDERDDEARVAARALGMMGDARGVKALLDAYADGWRPNVVSEAMVFMGAPALRPLLLLLDERPELAKRKGALGVLATMPAEDVVPILVERVEQAADAEQRAARIGLYLHATAEGVAVHKALAAKLAEVVSARLEAARATSNAAVEAKLYLRACDYHEDLHRTVATRILQLFPAPGGAEEKALVKSATRAAARN